MKIYTLRLVLILMVVFTNNGYAQDIYKIKDNNNVDIKLLGTSTLHDWEMLANKAYGEAQFVFSSENERELTSMELLTFNLEVKDLKSDSKGLDKNAYKALKTDKYKKIHYELSSSKQSLENGVHFFKTKGKLTIAGVTKNIEIDIHTVVNTNKTITCKGSYTLKMTDYNVEPPSFMLSIMKTGDDTTLDFEVTYIN